MPTRRFTFKAWDTPFCDRADLKVTLIHGDDCAVIVGYGENENARLYRVCANVLGVRILAEEWRTEFWARRDELGLREELGESFEILGSPWVEELRVHEPHLHHCCPGIRHLVIASDLTIFELLVGNEPTIVELDTSSSMIGFPKL